MGSLNEGSLEFLLVPHCSAPDASADIIAGSTWAAGISRSGESARVGRGSGSKIGGRFTTRAHCGQYSAARTPETVRAQVQHTRATPVINTQPILLPLPIRPLARPQTPIFFHKCSVPVSAYTLTCFPPFRQHLREFHPGSGNRGLFRRDNQLTVFDVAQNRF